MSGGLAGYVTVPRRTPDGLAGLAYITPDEAALLRHANVGGRNPGHRAYRGPGRVPRLDDGDGSDAGGSASEGGSASGGLGGLGNATAGTAADGMGGYGAGGRGGGGDADGPGGSVGAGTGIGLGGLSPAEGMGLGAFGSAAIADNSGLGWADGMLGLNPGTLGRGISGLLSGLGPAGMAVSNALGFAPTPSQAIGAALGMVPGGSLVGAAAGALGLGGILGSHGQTDMAGGMGGTNTNAGLGAGGLGGMDLSPLGLGAPGLPQQHGPQIGLAGEGGYRVPVYAASGYAQGGLAGYARGGRVGGSGHHPQRFIQGSGLVHGDAPGRADTVHATVPKGSYVLPADVVAGLGAGNTLAGAKHVTSMMRQHRADPGYADGGLAGSPTPERVRLSSGEFVVHPKHVRALGRGDAARGRAALDELVARTRKQQRKAVAAMPGPR